MNRHDKNDPKNYVVTNDGRTLDQIVDVVELQQLVMQQINLREKAIRDLHEKTMREFKYFFE